MAERKGIRTAPARSKRRDNRTALPATSISSWCGVGDTGVRSQSQGDLLPGLHAVVIGLVGKLRDGEMAVLVDDRCLGARAAQSGSRPKDKLEILVRFLVPENSLGDLEQAAEFDQGRNASACRRLERLFANPTESERAETSLVSDAEQVVAFRQCTNGTGFAFG